MIILDTNVLSALMRTAPEAPVVAWLDRQPAESVWITSITLFEARLGLALLPTGRRRQTLEAAFARLLKEDLENRVLDFDSAAAADAALLAAERHGRSMEEEVRHILRNVVKAENTRLSKLGSRIAARFRKSGLTTELPELRGEPVRSADFGK